MSHERPPLFSVTTRCFFIGVCTFVAGFLVALAYPPSIPAGSLLEKIVSSGTGETRQLGLSEVRKLDAEVPLVRLKEAYEIMAEKYYGFSTVSKDALVTGMIRGMVDALADPHSTFFDEEETKDFEEALKGEFQGIGAYVGKSSSGVLVKQVFDGSPAKDAGILPGDIIAKADDFLLADLEVGDAVKKIRGPAGSQVTLGLIRPSEKNRTFEKQVTRRYVQVPSVVSKMIENTKVGVITVGIFGETTADEFGRAYDALSGSGMQALVVDLRDNPGGVLDTSVDLLSNFVESGKLVVETRGISENSSGERISTPGMFFEDPNNTKYYANGKVRPRIPLVVLVNGDSASASEIVAGALQDYGLATIVGTKTYGKWSVQSAFKLRDSSELKITVARWYTPNGKWIDKLGITPDVKSEPLPEDFENRFDRVLDIGRQIAEYELSGKTRKEAVEHFSRPVTP